MSEKTIAMLGLAVGLVTLYVTVRMAIGLMKLQEDADKTISDFKASPVGGVLGALGLK